MTKIRFASFFLLTIVVSIAFSGADRSQKKFVTEEQRVTPSPTNAEGNPVVAVGTLNWVFVDSMNNCYGMLSNVVDPLAFDPNSGIAAVIHRANTGYGLGSGQLWYNMTTDGGATWIRISELNAGAPNLSRYPSATISNPVGASAARFCWAAPQLNPGAFGYVIYGCENLGSGASCSVVDEDANDYWSNTRITSADDSPYVWWLTRTTGGYFHVWRSTDCDTVYESEPWPATDFTALGQDAGLAYRNGTLYFGVFATFPGDPGVVFNVAYSASTDSGTTWGPWQGPNIGTGDWRTLPGITGTVYTDWHEQNSFDMVVDANGYVHFFGIVVDDFTTPTMLAVAEIYETSSGWAANIIAEGLSSTTYTNYGQVDQMGYHVNSAISADGMAMAVNWLSAPAEGDTLPDIYGSVRHLNSTDWSIAENYTNTPDFAELLVQVAPTLRSDGGDDYTLFLSRVYQCGNPPPPYPPSDVSCAYIFAATKNLTIPLTEVEEGRGLPTEYRLDQNYPNPFNGISNVEFRISKLSEVTVKIYDVLGREVVTLVNEELAPGVYRRSWDGRTSSGMQVGSGVYFYKLNTPGFSDLKRMILLK